MSNSVIFYLNSLFLNPKTIILSFLIYHFFHITNNFLFVYNNIIQTINSTPALEKPLVKCTLVVVYL